MKTHTQRQTHTHTHGNTYTQANTHLPKYRENLQNFDTISKITAKRKCNSLAKMELHSRYFF